MDRPLSPTLAPLVPRGAREKPSRKPMPISMPVGLRPGLRDCAPSALKDGGGAAGVRPGGWGRRLAARMELRAGRPGNPPARTPALQSRPARPSIPPAPPSGQAAGRPVQPAHSPRQPAPPAGPAAPPVMQPAGQSGQPARRGGRTASLAPEAVLVPGKLIPFAMPSIYSSSPPPQS